ncbi:lysophospholipid acyltransferase family protein [Stutzerimonas chloritidismutans]|uniref:lysophospholipid acyltransferase family protein n=1 Tax=Stutzerimonas chloritidismutans TaxID=203192 RepID=UPI003F1671CD
MRRLRFLARLTRLAGVILVGLLLACGLSVLDGIGRPASIAARQRLCQWFLARLASALPFDVKLSGEPPGRPMLWLANHQSWSDIPLLGMLVPMTFLAKSEVRLWPVFGWLAAQAGTRFIQRGQGDTLQLGRQLSEHLRQGRDLLIFPEGTTTDGTTLRPFHPRLLSCAVDTATPIQPVAIRYSRNGCTDPIAPFIGDDDLLSHLFRLMMEDRATVDIQLLRPIDTADMERSRLGRLCHASIHQALFGEPPSLRRAA